MGEISFKQGREVLCECGTLPKVKVKVCWIKKLEDQITLAHHQYFDHDEHKGSPSGEVQLGAHILAVADSYDAMTTDRPYRLGMPPWKSIEKLKRCTGTQFDPEVVACFKRTLFQYDGTHQILSGD